MTFLKRLVRKSRTQQASHAQPTGQCNYSNNYYGDQVCTLKKTTSV
jgi:hypothetical protein